MEPNPTTTNTSLFNLNLDPTNAYTLRSAASWARVFAICSIIIGALVIVLAIFAQSIFAAYSSGFGREGLYDNPARGVVTAAVVVYVILGLIYLFSGIFALNFAARISRALKTNDQAAVSSGFSALRNFFALWAILLIICILFMLIMVLASAGSRY